MIPQNDIYAKLFAIIAKGVPKLFEAENFVEGKARIVPNSVFIESRDVLSHLRDIAINTDDIESINKNIIEIQEHIRRGIIETYQEYYDYIASNMFKLYVNYKTSYIRFEKLLMLYKVNKDLHKKIDNTIKQSQQQWLEARALKNNELDSENFNIAIDKFKLAFDNMLSIENDINILYNNLYKRSFIITFLFLICISIFIYVLIIQ